MNMKKQDKKETRDRLTGPQINTINTTVHA